MTIERHRSAVKFLMGLGTNPDLTRADQSKLRELMRGPFAQGMTENEAGQVLKSIKWDNQ